MIDGIRGVDIMRRLSFTTVLLGLVAGCPSPAPPPAGNEPYNEDEHPFEIECRDNEECPEGNLCTEAPGYPRFCRISCDTEGDPCLPRHGRDRTCTQVGGDRVCAFVRCGTGTFACEDSVCCDVGEICIHEDAEARCVPPRGRDESCIEALTSGLECELGLRCVVDPDDQERGFCREICATEGVACDDGGVCRATVGFGRVCLPGE